MLAASGCRLKTAGTAEIPEGKFLMGSTIDERAAAIELAYASEDRVHSDAHAWLREELEQTEISVPSYRIMIHPVTQLDYLGFVRETGHPEPYIDRDTWLRAQPANTDAAGYHQIARFFWVGGEPDQKRVRHPVVLVSHADATSYCAWWGAKRRGDGRLPSEAEWERAARGDHGSHYPWGDSYEPGHLNSKDGGIGDTVAIGLFEEQVSPHGVHDTAGNVFEWTATPTRGGSYVVKGGAWNTSGSIARPAARHARPAAQRHVAIGFRCVLEPTHKKRDKTPDKARK